MIVQRFLVFFRTAGDGARRGKAHHHHRHQRRPYSRRSTVAPPNLFFYEIAGFETISRPYLLKYGVPCASPTSSVDIYIYAYICIKNNNEGIFFHSTSFLVSSRAVHYTFVGENRCFLFFWGEAIALPITLVYTSYLSMAQNVLVSSFVRLKDRRLRLGGSRFRTGFEADRGHSIEQPPGSFALLSFLSCVPFVFCDINFAMELRATAL